MPKTTKEQRLACISFFGLGLSSAALLRDLPVGAYQSVLWNVLRTEPRKGKQKPPSSFSQHLSAPCQEPDVQCVIQTHAGMGTLLIVQYTQLRDVGRVGWRKGKSNRPFLLSHFLQDLTHLVILTSLHTADHVGLVFGSPLAEKECLEK